MIEGSYQKAGLMRALAALPKRPLDSLRDLRSLFSGNSSRSLLYEQVERDRLRLEQKVQGLSGQLSDLMHVALPGESPQRTSSPGDPVGGDLPHPAASREPPPLQV